MPEKPPSKESPGGAGNIAYLEQSLWRQLSEAATVEEFSHSWLGLLAHQIEGISLGAVFFHQPDTGTLSPAALWPPGNRDASHFGSAVERVLQETKGIVLRGPSGEDGDLQIAYPVRIGDTLHGVAVLELTPRSSPRLQATMRQLQWGVAWLQNWALRRAAEPEAAARRRMASTLDLTAVVLEQSSFQDAAMALVTEMSAALECDRVSLGLLEGSRVKVHALSHSTQFGKGMNLIRSIGMAMSESLDQDAALVHPDPEGSGKHVLQAHQQLARGHGDGAVCTVPFVDAAGQARGALTLERTADDQPFDGATRDLCEATAALVGPILLEKQRNDRSLPVKALDSLREQTRRLLGPGHSVRKLLAVGLLALALFFGLATGRYRVTAPMALEGEIQRAVVAPFRGFIFEAPGRAGDVVNEGDLLCNLDVRDLRLEYSKWSSERERHAVEHRRAMAEGDVASMNVISKRMGQADAQLALLDEQLARARITAPFDGLIVSGDLSQSLGAPVESGQVLFEVAPLDSYRVMLRVGEADIRDVAPGQTGELILTAIPDTRIGFRVSRVTPVSVSEEGRSYFLAEAELDEVSARLRPGMEGFAKIDIDRRRLLWIWSHGLVDWVRLKTWRWWF